MKTTPFLLALTFLASPAFADSSDEIAERLKSSGYRCTDTPDGDGSFCIGGSPKNYIVIPKNIEVTKTVFYAHGLVGVCGNGASGERYLKNESKTLRKLNAVSVMPWRASAGNAGFPLTSFIQRMDKFFGTHPLIFAGHSAAGPFFASELNGNGAGIAGRVEKVVILDGGYGDTRQRYQNAMSRNPNMKVRIVATTTLSNSRSLNNYLSSKFAGRVQLDAFGGGDHCGVPAKYFKLLAN